MKESIKYEKMDSEGNIETLCFICATHAAMQVPFTGAREGCSTVRITSVENTYEFQQCDRCGNFLE